MKLKLTQRQKHVLSYMVACVAIWTFTLSGMLFMKSGPESMEFMVPTWTQAGDFFSRALPLTIPFGLITGLFFSLASMPRKPLTQLRMDTLREGVLDHLRDCDDRTREMALIFEWAGRAGWSTVEATVRRNPEKYPYAALLLARSAEVLPFKREA